MTATIRDMRRDGSDHPQVRSVPVTVHRLAFVCLECVAAEDDPLASLRWMRGAHAGEDGRLRCSEHHREKYGAAAFLVCPACEQGKPAEEWEAPPRGEATRNADGTVSASLEALGALFEQEREVLREHGHPSHFAPHRVVARSPCRECRDRTCSECGADITHMRADALTCSASCRQKRRRRHP